MSVATAEKLGNVITVLTASKRLVKTWRADGTIAPYDDAKNYTVEHREVEGIRGLSQALRELQRKPNVCVVRGQFVGLEEAAKREKLERPDKTFRRASLFDDVPRHWVLIEVDEFQPMTADAVADPVAAIDEYVSTCLPPEFHGVAYHWQLSNSSGHPDKLHLLKAHLWFWLMLPYTSAQLKGWAGQIKLKADHSVLNTVQCHYTGAPVFEPGVTDPVPVRCGYVPGVSGDEVALSIDTSAIASVAAPKASRSAKLKDAIHTDPIAQHLIDKGWVKVIDAKGWLHIDCPFADEHTGASGVTATSYMPRLTGGFLDGQFKCMHAHCADRPKDAYLSRLGLGADDFEMIVSEPTPAALPIQQAATVPSPFPAPFRGVMADAVAVALSAAPKPQPELMTLGVLIGMAACCAGNYRLPSGARLNLYAVGVAGTGWGKDAPRTAAVEIAKAGGAKLIGKPASGQGLEDAVVAFKGMLSEIDEIAHLFAAINASAAPAYLVELAANLLRLFTSSNGTYTTRQRASAKNVMPSRSIEHPCVSLIGFATPEKLGEALGVSNVEDGLMGRVLFAFGRADIIPRRSFQRFSLPSSMATAVGEIRGAITATDFGDPFLDIQVTPDADAALDQLLIHFHLAATNAASPFACALQMRSYEKCERVAGVLAVWDRPKAPVVTLEHVRWAEQLVAASDRTALHFCGAYMHGGQVQADAARVQRAIVQIMKGEIKAERESEAARVRAGQVPRSLVLRASKLDKRRFDEAVAHLTALGDLTIGQADAEQTNGRKVQTQLLTTRSAA